MKRILSSLVAAVTVFVTASSCTSYVHTISTERRHVSQTGVELALKTVSVSFVEGSQSDSLFMADVADFFALSLEKEFFEGESAIELFDIKATEGADYSSRDTLAQLVMSTDSDVAILFDQPSFAQVNTRDTLVKFNLYVYDSLNDKADTVRTFFCKKTVRSLDGVAPKIGELLASYFAPSWEREDVSIYFFDSDEWVKPADLANSGKWKEAMNLWLDLTSTKNSMKRATASYNIAVCCYMLEEYGYALKWLERADADAEIANVPSLRRKIINAQANQ